LQWFQKKNVKLKSGEICISQAKFVEFIKVQKLDLLVSLKGYPGKSWR